MRRVPLVLHSEKDCIVIRSEECINVTATLALDSGTASLVLVCLNLLVERARDIHQASSSDQDEATFFNASRLVYKYDHPSWFEGWCLFAFQDLTTQQQSGLRWDLKNVMVLTEHQAAHSSPELIQQPQPPPPPFWVSCTCITCHVIHPSYLILGLRQNAGAIISWPSSLTLWIVYLPFIPKSLSQI